MAFGAVLLLLTAVSPLAHSQATGDELLSELAGRIAVAVGPETQIALEGGAEDNAMAALLAARGLRLVSPADGIPAVRVTCLHNLRERSCTADLRTGAVRRSVIATRRLESARPPSSASAVLALRTILIQRTAILDVAPIGDRLLVLSPAEVALHERRGERWESTQAHPMSMPGVWPRDPRGRIKVDGDRFELFVPGATCIGTSNPFSLTCSAERRAWPIVIDNAVLEPARNYFRTSGGLEFYGAAAVAAQADVRWIVVDRNRSLVLLDDAGKPIATAGEGDDVVQMSSCGGANHIAVATAATDRDAIALFQVTGRRLLPAGSPIVMPGTVTALWPSPVGGAIVVTHDTVAGRYGAHQLTTDCSR